MARTFSVALALIATIMTAFATNAPQIALGQCSEFAVMAGTKASFDGEVTTINTGDVGVSPGDSVTGNYKLLTGTTEITSTKSNQCAADRITAYDAAAAAVCPPSNIVAELGGLTLMPGVYCATSSPMTFSAGTLTLDGQGDSTSRWIFQASSSLLTSTATSFILQNGAQASNIIWQVGSSATLGSTSSFAGTIVAYAAVSADVSVVLTGRALAGTGASFAGSNSITLPVETN